MKRRELVLASASPRRRELMPLVTALLPGYGEKAPFQVRPAQCDETLQGEPAPQEAVMELALRKARASWQAGGCREGEWVLGFDTLVYCEGKLLGKPRDPREAGDMLRLLSGKAHQVYTGVCLLGKGLERRDFCATSVAFYPLTEGEIRAYVATGEPLDKAGAYGIQQRGSVLVRGIQGDFYNVIGLPVALAYRMLRDEEERHR